MIGALLDSLRYAVGLKLGSIAARSADRGRIWRTAFFAGRGFIIVARNYRLPSGNGAAAIVAWDRDTLVIVEVKSRESGAYGPPDRAIDPEKLRHLRRVALEYGRKTETPPERIRFEVVTVVLTEPPELTLFRRIKANVS